MKLINGKINSLEIYKVEDGYEIHLNGLGISDIITCNNKEMFFEELKKLLGDLKEF